MANHTLGVVSAELALEALLSAVEDVEDTRALLASQIALRDDLIRSARNAEIPFRRLVKVTGLSRDRLYTIVNSPEEK